MEKLHIHRSEVADFIGLSRIEIRLADYLEQEASYFLSRSPAFPTSHEEHSVWNVSREKKGREDRKDTLSFPTWREPSKTRHGTGDRKMGLSHPTLFAYRVTLRTLLRLLQPDWNYSQAQTCLMSSVRTNVFWQRELGSPLPDCQAPTRSGEEAW